ncbi:MAG: phage minor capsid protein [Faecalibacterium prausnitzii]
MLAPDYLDHAPDALVALWQEVEDTILRDVARRIGKMDALTPTANWQLWRYQQTEAVRKDVVKLLARYTGKSEAEIRRLMQEAATAALEAEDEIYYHYGKEPRPLATMPPAGPAQRWLSADGRNLPQPHRHHGQHRQRPV